LFWNNLIDNIHGINVMERCVLNYLEDGPQDYETLNQKFSDNYNLDLSFESLISSLSRKKAVEKKGEQITSSLPKIDINPSEAYDHARDLMLKSFPESSEFWMSECEKQLENTEERWKNDR